MGKKKIKTIRELISKAQDDIDTYKYPNTEELVSRLDPILSALGEGRIDKDRITSIYFVRGELIIDTEYYVRCCHQSNSFEIPIEILDASDPVCAANIRRINRKIEKLSKDVSFYEVSLKNSIEELEKAKIELNSLQNKNA